MLWVSGHPDLSRMFQENLGRLGGLGCPAGFDAGTCWARPDYLSKAPCWAILSLTLHTLGPS